MMSGRSHSMITQYESSVYGFECLFYEGVMWVQDSLHHA